MDIKWKKYSHSWLIKLFVFMIVIVCFSGAITMILNVVIHEDDLSIAFEKDYYLSKDYTNDTERIIYYLKQLISEYKSEEYILSGGTIDLNEWKRIEERFFEDFKRNSKSYNSKLTDGENYETYKEVYADKIAKAKSDQIEEDLRIFNLYLHELEDLKGVIYYASNGENVFTNNPNLTKDKIKTYPSHIIITNDEQIVYPEKIKENPHYRVISYYNDQFKQNDDVMYIAYTEEFIDSNRKEWEKNKKYITNVLYKLVGSTLGLILAFIYLMIVIGRKRFDDKQVHFQFVDRLYNDVKVLLSFALIAAWFVAMIGLFDIKFYEAIFPVTLIITTLGLIFVLSLVKQIKNKTLMKHSFLYLLLKKIVIFLKEIYDSGSIGFKVVLAVIGYPIIVALTYYFAPVTMGIVVWLAHKKVKEYTAIKEGIERIKEGDLQHQINIAGNGELTKLANDINRIAEGFKKAISNEMKSERLKTELITNVSHDLRTPLTSIITYIDLLKKEKEPLKVKEYIEILDQKSQRLKLLTEDLFEAAKASSGNIPVQLEQIELISLITQGLGELNDKIQETKLEFKINHSTNKVYIQADGKLLWRAIENLLSNIFKYALQGSRVYIDIEDMENQAILVIKNISANELNVSSDELIERFKRGDESRSSQGSGLGLSIAKSLIEIQHGSFHIEIDGDLFKAIIKMPKGKK